MTKKDKTDLSRKDRRISNNSTTKSDGVFIRQVEPDRVIKYKPFVKEQDKKS